MGVPDASDPGEAGSNETGMGGEPQTQRKVSLTIIFKVVFESSLQAVPHKIYYGLEMIRYNTNF